jgi:hypothetical protein
LAAVSGKQGQLMTLALELEEFTHVAPSDRNVV